MPGVDGLEVLSRLGTLAPDTAVIVMTAHGSVRSAVEAMQRGAYDYLTKPFDNDEVRLLAERALSARALAREVVELRTGIQEVWEFGALVGKSPRMQEVYKTIGRIAGTDVTVLLRGESGTGKEVVARAIHHYSRRAGKPFVAVSCAAIPATLLESELFGHERGRVHGRAPAPPRALRARPGRHPVPRRGRGSGARAPAQAPAGSPGTAARAGWRRRGDPRRCPRRRGDQPGPGDAHPGRPLPRGPLLPPERRHPHPAAAPRAHRRRAVPGGPLSREVRHGAGRAGPRGRGPRAALGLQLAGERPRAGERDPARDGDGGGRGHPARALAHRRRGVARRRRRRGPSSSSSSRSSRSASTASAGGSRRTSTIS